MNRLLKELRDFKISKTNLTKISGGKMTSVWTITLFEDGSRDYIEPISE